MKVPFADLKLQYAALKPEMDAAIAEVITSTAFIGGSALRQFEAAFAAAQRTKHCIGVGNGTDALVVALKCLGVGPGDVVATSAASFIATSEAITLAGARTVFVDCGDDYDMDPAALERVLDRQKKAGKPVKAIIPVHLYGRTCNMTAIGGLANAHGAAIVEDCAQAHLAERMRMFANHGRKDKYDHEFEGTNSRLDNLQAAVLGVKLPHLRSWTEKRIAAAARYRERLGGISGLVLPPPASGFEHVYHLYVVRVPNREAVRARLKENGVDTGVHYPAALPNLPAYRHIDQPKSDWAKATSFESSILSLPMFPEITETQIDYVAEQLRRALG